MPFGHLKRREFITLLGGAAAWPLAARAQQRERMRLIGVLLPGTAGDLQYQARVAAFVQGLQAAGWIIGRNIRIDTRWATTNAADIRRQATELAALTPDGILAHGSSTVGPLLHATRLEHHHGEAGIAPIVRHDRLHERALLLQGAGWR